MKTNTTATINNVRSLLLFASVFLAVGSSRAQSPSPSIQQGAVVGDYAITHVGPHSRVWVNSAGQTVTEIATGMNYLSAGQWTPSDPSFVGSVDGTSFIAAKIQDPTRLAVNLNRVGAVTVTTPDNVTLSSTPIAIGLYDAASGKSVIVATITNTTGVLADAQDVVYDGAFVGGGFAASVVYSLPDTGSFHQDVVFTGFDPAFNPTNWGFAESSTNSLQIQIFTEFYDPPEPLVQTNLIYVEQDPAIRASMVSPDLIDYTFDFGDYVFGPGRAYTSAANGSTGGGVRVLKDFVTDSGRTFLVESIPYLSLARQLKSLPPIAANVRSSTHPATAKRSMFAASSVPSLMQIKPAPLHKTILASQLALAASKPSGVIVDYIVAVSSSTKPVVYSSDTTYFVSGNVYNSSAVTMESAVFKYPKGLTGYIEVESTLNLATTNYRPAVFTSADDNTAGTTLSTAIWSGYTGHPGTNRYGDVALWLNTATNIALNNLRFCYVNCAIEIAVDTGGGQTVSLSHSQVVDSGEAISLDCGGTSDALTLNVENCLIADVLDAFENQTNYIPMELTGVVCNCTIDSCAKLISSPIHVLNGTFGFTNSIFSSVTANGFVGYEQWSGGYNGFYNNGAGFAFGTPQTSVSFNPYQTAGAGNYYLPSNSTFLSNGTSDIDAALLSQLQMKTVLAPLSLTNLFATNTMLTPMVQRDTNATALGWHYDPIDYMVGCSVFDATLLLTNGVALAYGDYTDTGITLLDNSKLVSQGTPTARNYLAYYGLVQEQPTNLWGFTNAVAQALPISPFPTNSANKPSIFLRLTTICAPQGETNLLNTGDTGEVISGLTFRDCEVYGAGANWMMNESNNTPLVGLTNNVFHRVPLAITNDASIIAYNNLFYGTTNTNEFTISIQRRSGTSSNIIENNVFDGVSASLVGQSVGYNAYLHGATNTAYTNDVVWTNSFAWVPGPLGAYYQSNSSPLLYNGSTYASNIALYHYTVTTNEEIEGTNIVCRGYHYVALGTNGLPLCSNTNGVPDYLADANGNGIVDPGEIPWFSDVVPYGWSVLYGLTYTPELDGQDPDEDSLSNLQEYLYGTDPIVNQGFSVWVSEANNTAGIP